MIDISGLSYFMPLISFIFVLFIIYAVLAATKILGGSKGIDITVAIIIAVIFAVVAPAQEYVQTITPWFVVFAISLFFILLLIGLSKQDIGSIMKPGFVWVLVIALIIVFLVAAIKIVPASFGDVWYSTAGFITNEARIAGGIMLLIVAGLAAWVLTKS